MNPPAARKDTLLSVMDRFHVASPTEADLAILDSLLTDARASGRLGKIAWDADGEAVSALLAAVETGRADVVRRVLQAGAPVNPMDVGLPEEATPFAPYLPLVRAVRWAGSSLQESVDPSDTGPVVDVIAALVEGGADARRADPVVGKDAWEEWADYAGDLPSGAVGLGIQVTDRLVAGLPAAERAALEAALAGTGATTPLAGELLEWGEVGPGYRAWVRERRLSQVLPDAARAPASSSPRKPRV